MIANVGIYLKKQR
ncbi:hypothetical protein YPPY66_2252, partial [Yersinia pestis PY-66]